MRPAPEAISRHDGSASAAGDPLVLLSHTRRYANEEEEFFREARQQRFDEPAPPRAPCIRRGRAGVRSSLSCGGGAMREKMTREWMLGAPVKGSSSRRKRRWRSRRSSSASATPTAQVTTAAQSTTDALRPAWKSNFENNLALGERLKRFEIFLRENPFEIFLRKVLFAFESRIFGTKPLKFFARYAREIITLIFRSLRSRRDV